MERGDLVKYTSLDNVVIGVVTGFDEDDDPYVVCIETGEQDLVWRHQAEVLSEER